VSRWISGNSCEPVLCRGPAPQCDRGRRTQNDIPCVKQKRGFPKSYFAVQVATLTHWLPIHVTTFTALRCNHDLLAYSKPVYTVRPMWFVSDYRTAKVNRSTFVIDLYVEPRNNSAAPYYLRDEPVLPHCYAIGVNSFRSTWMID
jgi:hypothetical protein